MLALTAKLQRPSLHPARPVGLSDNQLKLFDKIFSSQPTRNLEPQQHLFHEGDEDRTIYRIETGMIRLYRLLSDGRRQIISFRFAGDVLGIEATSRRHCSAEAVSQAKLQCLDSFSAYRSLKDEPALAPQLVTLLSKELDNARSQIAVLNRRSAIEKLAAFILELHARQGNRGEIELQLSRTDIADFLGLTIETVSRNLTKLRTHHVIQLLTIHKLIILDIGRLQDLADGERDDW